MTKIINLAALSGCALTESLGVIRQTHLLLHVPPDTTTATALASRIELCDALLVAISGVRNSLAKDLISTRESPPLGLN
jgi:hypothetical protein